jgi:hypothetical protein
VIKFAYLSVISLGYLPSVMARQNVRDVPNQNSQMTLVANKSSCQNTLRMIGSQLGLVKSAQIKQISDANGKYPPGRSMVADLTIVNRAC